MMKNVNCPTCGHLFAVADAGNRQTCPNCESLFVPGKPGDARPSPKPPAVNKTMLGETAPPTRFHCPRCNQAMEAAACDVGAKMPCPGCGQLVPVPLQAGAASSTTPSSQSVPDARGERTKRALLIGGGLLAAVGVVVLVLIACVLAVFVGGGRNSVANAQKEIDALEAKLKQEEYDLERRLEQERRDFEAKKAAADQLDMQKRLLGQKNSAEAVKLQQEQDERERERQAEREKALALAKIKPVVTGTPSLGTVTVVAGDDLARDLITKIGVRVLARGSKKPHVLRPGAYPLPPGDYAVAKMKGVFVEPNVFTLQPGATVQVTASVLKK